MDIDNLTNPSQSLCLISESTMDTCQHILPKIESGPSVNLAVRPFASFLTLTGKRFAHCIS